MGLNLKKNQREFQKKLETFLGSRNVYFQPPSSVRMKYPAIVYAVARTNGQHADNQKYRNMIGYTVTFIDRVSNGELSLAFEDAFPYCRFDRFYDVDNLAHYSYLIYN